MLFNSIKRSFLLSSAATAPARPKSRRAAKFAYLVVCGLSVALSATTAPA